MLMRSSVLPVASRTFCDWPGVGTEGGERARQRMAELWALKRKVSANEAVLAVVLSFDYDFAFGVDDGFTVAVTPWRTRS
jgi:hypothetical protein